MVKGIIGKLLGGSGEQKGKSGSTEDELLEALKPLSEKSFKDKETAAKAKKVRDVFLSYRNQIQVSLQTLADNQDATDTEIADMEKDLTQLLLTLDKLGKNKVDEKSLSSFQTDLNSVGARLWKIIDNSSDKGASASALRERQKLILEDDEKQNKRFAELADSIGQPLDEFIKENHKLVGSVGGSGLRLALASVLGPAAPIVSLIDGIFNLDKRAESLSKAAYDTSKKMAKGVIGLPSSFAKTTMEAGKASIGWFTSRWSKEDQKDEVRDARSRKLMENQLKSLKEMKSKLGSIASSTGGMVMNLAMALGSLIGRVMSKMKDYVKLALAAASPAKALAGAVAAKIAAGATKIFAKAKDFITGGGSKGGSGGGLDFPSTGGQQTGGKGKGRGRKGAPRDAKGRYIKKVDAAKQMGDSFANQASGLSKAGKVMKYGGAALGAVGGLVGMYEGGDTILRNKNKGFFESGEGGVTDSRAGGYGSSVLGGAMTGAAIGSVIPVVGTAVGAAVGAAVGGLTAAVIDNKEALGKMASSMWESTKAFGSSLADMTKSLGDWAAGVWGKTKDAAANAWENTKAGAANLVDKAKKSDNLWVKGAVAVGNHYVGAGKAVVGGVSAASDAVKSFVSKPPTVDEAKQAIGNTASAAKDQVVHSVGTASEVVKGVAAAPDKLQTAQDLTGQVVAGKTSKDVVGQRKQGLLQALDQQGITDPKERAAFVAQANAETGGMRFMSEGKYTAKSVWKLRGKQLEKMGVTEEEVKRAEANGGSDAMYEYMYGDKYRQGASKMGNTEAGDAAKYKGRGIFQLTGKKNYEAYGKELGIDLVKNPELAEDPKVSAQIAALYWKKGGLGKHARNGDIDKVSAGINAGNVNADLSKVHGLDTRRSEYQKALADQSVTTAGVVPSTTAGSTQVASAAAAPTVTPTVAVKGKLDAATVNRPAAPFPTETKTAAASTPPSTTTQTAAVVPSATGTTDGSAPPPATLVAANNSSTVETPAASPPVAKGSTGASTTTAGDAVLAGYSFEMRGSDVLATNLETGEIDMATPEQAKAYKKQQGQAYKDSGDSYKAAVAAANDPATYKGSQQAVTGESSFKGSATAAPIAEAAAVPRNTPKPPPEETKVASADDGGSKKGSGAASSGKSTLASVPFMPDDTNLLLVNIYGMIG